MIEFHNPKSNIQDCLLPAAVMSLLMIGAGALSGQRSKAQAAEQKAQAALQPKAQTIFGAKLKSVDVARNTVTVATVNPVKSSAKAARFLHLPEP